MKRRSFLLGLGGLGAASLIPTSLLKKVSINLLPYTTPQWAPATTIAATPYILYQYNKCVAISPCLMENTYIRCFELVMAANNITERDIINEFYSKYDEDEAFLTTTAAEGDFGMGFGTFRRHNTVGWLKQHFEGMRERQLSEVGRRIEKDIPKLGKYIYTAHRDGNYIVHTSKYENGKEKVRKERLYDIESYAKEMVSGRVRYNSPQEIARRRDYEVYYKNNHFPTDSRWS
jgi:hypothetical protein